MRKWYYKTREKIRTTVKDKIVNKLTGGKSNIVLSLLNINPSIGTFCNLILNYDLDKVFGFLVNMIKSVDGKIGVFCDDLLVSLDSQMALNYNGYSTRKVRIFGME